jgi:hypothetical protein
MCAAVVIMDYTTFFNTEEETNFQPFNVTEDCLCITGWRHAQCWETIRLLTGKTQNYFILNNVTTQEGDKIVIKKHERMWEDGFLTTKNRFLSREKAYMLVKKTGQLKKELIGGMLTSEDLW